MRGARREGSSRPSGLPRCGGSVGSAVREPVTCGCGRSLARRKPKRGCRHSPCFLPRGCRGQDAPGLPGTSPPSGVPRGAEAAMPWGRARGRSAGPAAPGLPAAGRPGCARCFGSPSGMPRDPEAAAPGPCVGVSGRLGRAAGAPRSFRGCRSVGGEAPLGVAELPTLPALRGGGGEQVETDRGCRSARVCRVLGFAEASTGFLSAGVGIADVPGGGRRGCRRRGRPPHPLPGLEGEAAGAWSPGLILELGPARRRL